MKLVYLVLIILALIAWAIAADAYDPTEAAKNIQAGRPCLAGCEYSPIVPSGGIVPQQQSVPVEQQIEVWVEFVPTANMDMYDLFEQMRRRK